MKKYALCVVAALALVGGCAEDSGTSGETTASGPPTTSGSQPTSSSPVSVPGTPMPEPPPATGAAPDPGTAPDAGSPGTVAPPTGAPAASTPPATVVPAAGPCATVTSEMLNTTLRNSPQPWPPGVLGTPQCADRWAVAWTAPGPPPDNNQPTGYLFGWNGTGWQVLNVGTSLGCMENFSVPRAAAVQLRGCGG